MEYIERVAKKYNRSFDEVFKCLIEWVTTSEVRRTQFDNFVKNKIISGLNFSDIHLREIWLFNDSYNLLARWAEERNITPNEAANLIITSFTKMALSDINILGDGGSILLKKGAE